MINPMASRPAESYETVRDWLASYLSAHTQIPSSGFDSGRRFEQYGLDSLSGARMIAELSRMTGRPLSPTLLWECPTPAQLARRISGETASAPSTDGGITTPGLAAEPIAIVGLACRFPGADGPSAFWNLLANGLDATSPPPGGRWEMPDSSEDIPVKRAGFLERIDLFDPEFFGISPREATQMDPQQRLALELSWEAFEDAGIRPGSLAGSRTGVYFGAWTDEYARLRKGRLDDIGQHTSTGQNISIIAARVSYVLGLQGPSMTVNTACSSALVALHLACQSLRMGESGLAVAGGVNILCDAGNTMELWKFGGLSPDGRCKAFDAGANGFARGEGGGAVLLKPLSRALRDGDRIHCLLLGTAVNNDGFSNGLSAPNPAAQQSLLREAYRVAARSPGRVHYVEAHGTGTRLGDPIEANSLGAVLGQGREKEQPLLIGSVKSNIGHLESAAGIAGLIKVVLSMRHRSVPPGIHFHEPNPEIAFDSLPLRVPTALEPWPERDTPSLAGVSSFGFGGTNSHAVVEEFPDRPGFLLATAAADAESLRDRVAGLRGSPEADELRSQISGSGPHRLALVARDGEHARSLLSAFLEGREEAGWKSGVATAPPKIGFVFSGQGSQWVGMARQLAAREPVFRNALNACAALIEEFSGFSIHEELAKDAPHSRLNRTEVMWPAIFAVQVALFELYRSWGVQPAAVMGHSMGELAAAYAAGVLPLRDAARVICSQSRAAARWRGGAMLLASIPWSEAQRLETESPGIHAVIDAGASSVLAGNARQLQEIARRLADAGVFCAPVASELDAHYRRADSIESELREALEGLTTAPPAIPIAAAASGTWAAGEDLGIDYWSTHLERPVLFADSVRRLREAGCTVFVELSPHPIVTRAVRDCLKDEPVAVVPSLTRGVDERSPLLESMAALFVAGAVLNQDAIDGYASSEAHVFVLSAHSSAALEARVRKTAEWLSTAGEAASLRDICYTSAVRRDALQHRLALVVRSRQELIEELNAFATNAARTRKADGDSELCSLASSFTSGDAVDWERLYPEGGRCVPMPAYPWQRQRYWLYGSAEHEGKPLRDCCYRIEWKAKSRATAPSSAAQRWLILTDRERIGDHLAQRLREAGRTVSVVQPGEDPGRELQDCSAIVHLWSLESDSRDACASVARACESRARLWVVTRGAQVDVRAPEQSPVWGFCRVAALEHPDTWGGIIDLDPSADVEHSVSMLLPEILTNDGEDQVAFRAGDRWVPRLAPFVAAETRPLRLRPDAIYLITGGAGSLGLATARWMINKGARHLALASRNAPANGEALRTLRELGADVRAFAVDTGDRADVARLFEELKGVAHPLRGIVHAAGMLRRRPVVETTGLEDDFRAKLDGARYLHEFTLDMELDFFVLYSSAASVWGAAGMGGYAAANHYLDALADLRRRSGKPALSVNWGPWDGGGMAGEEMRQDWEKQGISLLPRADALETLGFLIASQEPRISVAKVDWGAFKRVYEARRKRPLLELLGMPDQCESGSAADDSSFARELASAPARRRRALVTGLVEDLVRDVLGHEAGKTIDPNTGFFDLGMDSMMSIELLERLEKALGAKLPSSLTLDYPNVAGLSSWLERRIEKEHGEREPAPKALHATVGGLSEDALALALATELEQLESGGDSR